MCDKNNGSSHSSSFFTGAVVGAIAGAALGLFFSPGTGEENRKKFKKLKNEYAEKGQIAYSEAIETYGEAKEAAAPFMADLDAKLRPILAEAKEAGDPVAGQVMEKIAQIVTEAADNMDETAHHVKKQLKKK